MMLETGRSNSSLMTRKFTEWANDVLLVQILFLGPVQSTFRFINL
jgi:hypothetical protein